MVLTCICNHPYTRKYYLEYKFFNKNLYEHSSNALDLALLFINCPFLLRRLPIFLYIKPPDESTLADLLPDDNVWTNGMETSKDTYLNGCKKLSLCTDPLYTLQKHLVEKLLNNGDGSDTTPSSRKIFIGKLRKYVVENSVEHRTIYFLEGHYTSPTQPAVALSFLCILLDVLKALFAEECADSPAIVTPNYFYDGSLKYFHFDRVGGVLSHLNRQYRNELTARLGGEHSALQPNADQTPSTFNGVELSDICKILYYNLPSIYLRNIFCFRFSNVFVDWKFKILIDLSALTSSFIEYNRKFEWKYSEFT